jgi:hypothetical protein
VKLVNRGSLLSPLFLIELHSSQPDKMVRFYEQRLSLKFKAKEYPYPCHMVRLGPVALMISGLAGHDGATTSEAGRCTFGLLSAESELPAGERYFLHPKRPLGRAWPTQYASRVQDPDGHYLAFASSMEDVMGREPPIQSFRELIDCICDYGLLVLVRLRKRLRRVIDSAIDRFEYATNRITCIRRNLGEHTHVVASREGLYAVNSTSYRLLVRGSFFGATVKDNAIYCFQSCGKEMENRGRIVKLTMANNRISRAEVVIKGLDDGCHQIDFLGEDLLVVDCYNGRILQITPGRSKHTAYYPLGKLSREVASTVYHINSVAGHPDGTVWLLLHNSTRTPSEVVVVNRRFEVVRRFAVKAGAAHNIVFTNDSSEYLIADSSGARIISARGTEAEIGMRPRGISLDRDTCVIGDSFFCARPFRRYVPGRVHFFDRASWTCTGSLSLPAAPTEIRRIDGKDLSISNYCIAEARAVVALATQGFGASPRDTGEPAAKEMTVG